MIAYAAYTTTKRNLRALRGADWRICLSPATGLNSFGLPYSLDNGAWSAFTSGTEWDEAKFFAAVERLGAGADWVALPDIVEGGRKSFDLSLSHRWRVLQHTRLALIPTQDGMDPTYVERELSPRTGIFVGGSTAFKEGTMAMWAEMARRHGTWCHVGRVNTVRRIALCAAAGATSFDGSSATRYAKTLPKLELARRQPDIFAYKGKWF